jgi:DNA end-binding protein Ku
MPAARANWKGTLRLSFVIVPIALYPATSEENKITLNRTNLKTGNRLRQKMVDGGTGEEVPAEDVGKSFENDKTSRVIVTDEELEAIELESKRSIQLEQFVPTGEIDERYVVRPYYIVPDGDDATEAFNVIREAMDRKGVSALGKVMLSSREHVMALHPFGKGMLGQLLRYPGEVRKAEEYFGEIGNTKIDDEMVEMAEVLIDKHAGHFDPGRFKDRYGDALKALVDRKMKGQKIYTKSEARDDASDRVINLMDVLRKSVKESGGSVPAAGKRRVAPPRAASANKRPASGKRSSARGGRKAG